METYRYDVTSRPMTREQGEGPPLVLPLGSRHYWVKRLRFPVYQVTLLYLQVHLLLKATADDGTPTPGYMYQEISGLCLNSCNNIKSLCWASLAFAQALLISKLIKHVQTLSFKKTQEPSMTL